MEVEGGGGGVEVEGEGGDCWQEQCYDIHDRTVIGVDYTEEFLIKLVKHNQTVFNIRLLPSKILTILIISIFQNHKLIQVTTNNISTIDHLNLIFNWFLD